MKNLSEQTGAFTLHRQKYYMREFQRLQEAKDLVFSWNMAACVLGPLWGAWRQMWGFFWFFLIAELISFVTIARGLWAEPGGEKRLRYEQIMKNIAYRKEQMEKAMAQGESNNLETASQILDNLQLTASQLQQELAQESLVPWAIFGVILLIFVKIVEGFYANVAYEKKYRHWLAFPDKYKKGVSWAHFIMGFFLTFFIAPLTIFRFTHSHPDAVFKKIIGFPITKFPLEKELFFKLADLGDKAFDSIARRFGDVFEGVVTVISSLIKICETLFIVTPWPVVWLVFIVTAFRLGGLRMAIFTAAAISYLAFLGLWEVAMMTISLIGVGSLLCLVFGIPLGIWFGHNPRAYSLARPALDFMQTMPAFVYLIPIIAFFGTGKPPGILATIIFAMPPVVRLTALGISNIPKTTKEAAIAFGCSRGQLLWHVELPLAMPSIMTGINQTIMMSLSMVVIASLIGAEGLGALILEALQYAAKGQGLLAGLAILLCAMVMDRMVQGVYKSKS